MGVDMGQVRIDVVIPTYKPDKQFIELMEGLKKQTIKPSRIIIINTEEKYFNKLMYGTRFKEDYPNVEIKHISQREFNHGKTRNEGAKRSDAQILIFMTQDCIPADGFMIEELIRPMVDQDVAVTYARQLPNDDCKPIEKFTRLYNYPDHDRVQDKSKIGELGIKTYFCSNVCAAYKRYVFDELGGFVNFTIFNEDMLYAAKAVEADKKVVYASKAKVIHSHNYSAKQQFRRNFDLGVSQADHKEIFENVPSEGEGIRLVKETIAYLKEEKKHYLLLELFYKSACKLLGYKLGYNYHKLTKRMIYNCTMNQSYWERYWDKKQIPSDVHAGYGKNKEGL
jgi:rhamnosyltransferase